MKPNHFVVLVLEVEEEDSDSESESESIWWLDSPKTLLWSNSPLILVENHYSSRVFICHGDNGAVKKTRGLLWNRARDKTGNTEIGKRRGVRPTREDFTCQLSRSRALPISLQIRRKSSNRVAPSRRGARRKKPSEPLHNHMSAAVPMPAAPRQWDEDHDRFRILEWRVEESDGVNNHYGAIDPGPLAP
ncbi:hypothetical protein NL676_029582 [Syzygium grande]|nr:hypothetical protein NL676_029582 [Syzygium grande]